jgi:nucleoside-diphosphate-sugar epimerase
MTGTVLVLGATGQIGRSVVPALLRDGWRVRAASLGGRRGEGWPPEVETLALDREEPGALAAAVGDGCEVLVDCVAYGAEHARQLTALSGRVGSAVVVSSAAVYTDGRGRGFDTQAQPDGHPHYPLPLAESCTTVAPGEESYATRKVAMERELLACGDRLPVTLLRAAAVHGRFSRTPRELYFVKRALDRRPVRVLAYGGRSRFQPVHTDNIAELTRLAAARPGSRILNAGDPQAPTVAEIGEAVDAVLGHSGETVLVEGAPPAPGVGDSPWSAPNPMVLDMTRAERELGYRPVVGYADALPATVEWTVGMLSGTDWRTAFPAMPEVYGEVLFDYAAEDRWLAGRAPAGS